MERLKKTKQVNEEKNGSIEIKKINSLIIIKQKLKTKVGNLLNKNCQQ